MRNLQIPNYLIDNLPLRLFKKPKKGKRKNLVKKSFQYNFGEQDQVDLISYSGLEEQSTHLQIGEKFARTLFISGYPFVATTGWLNMLVNFNHNIDISYLYYYSYYYYI